MNNIVTAPQIVDVDSLYEIWRQSYPGSRAMFYSFLTTPSPERDIFLNGFSTEITFNGAIASTITRIA